MSWDPTGRRIVEHETLLHWWREALERDNRNRGIKPDTPTYAEDLL